MWHRLAKQEKPQWGQGTRSRLLAAADAALGVHCIPAAGGTQEPSAGPPAEAAGGDLESLRAEVQAAFPFCESLKGASNCVFGEGNPDADLVFVGEAPGSEEDRLGRPFVGAAGRKLDEIIQAMGFERASVYICNVLKARPPDNRTPLPDEVAAQAPFLYQQLRIIAPRIIVALGGPASKLLLDTDTGITRLRGHQGMWRDPDSGVEIPVMPTFHPAYLLRNYTPEVRTAMWSDMQQVVALLEGG